MKPLLFVVRHVDSCPPSPSPLHSPHGPREQKCVSSLYPERAKYPWVGCAALADGKGDERVAHGSELFMAADSKMITIGGGLVTFRRLQLASGQGEVPVGRLPPGGEDGRG